MEVQKKRETLKKVLKKLVPYRNLAKGLLMLCDSFTDEKTIDSLLDLIEKSIKTVKIQKNKIKMELEIKTVQKVKNQEELDILKEEIVSLINEK